MDPQLTIVAIILAACVAYTAHRLWKRLRSASAGDVRCAGCPLADTCTHKHQQATDTDCCHHTAGNDGDHAAGCGCGHSHP